jgi:hypothetical protein
MSRKKPGWTEPGAVIDREAQREARREAEARKGTAAANPVLSLAPNPPQPSARRRAASGASGASGASAASTRSARPTASAGDGSAGAPDDRSPAQIEADIERARQRLAGTLDELSERLSPRAVLRRGNAAVRGAFVAGDGSVRKDRAALAVGAVVSAIGGTVALRGLRRG